MDGGNASSELLSSLLGDQQLMERVSQLVAQSRGGASDVPSDGAAVHDSAEVAEERGADDGAGDRPAAAPIGLELLSSLLGGISAAPAAGATDPELATSAGSAPDPGTASDPPGSHNGTQAAAAPGTDSTSAADATSAASGGADRLAGLTSLLNDNDFMSKLPGVLSMLKPERSVAAGAPGPGKPPHPGCDRRVALLSALKPYMSPKRCEAIDYLIRINRMGDILRRVR